MSKKRKKKAPEAEVPVESQEAVVETTDAAPVEGAESPVAGENASESLPGESSETVAAEAEILPEEPSPQDAPESEAPVEADSEAASEASEEADPAENAEESQPETADESEDEALAAEEAGPVKFPLKQVVQAILFASQKPVSAKELISVFKGAAEAAKETPNSPALAFKKVKEEALRAAIEELEIECANPDLAFEVRENAAGWQLVTKPEYAPWLRQLFPENRPARLSAPSMETLAIIAYRQPITRADIEAVRGVAVDGVMQTLLDRGLVKIAGRADIPGRPLLYETTTHFMEHFGLKNLDDLPNASELRKISLPTADAPSDEKAPAKAAKGGAATPAPAPEEAPAGENAGATTPASEPQGGESSEPTNEVAETQAGEATGNQALEEVPSGESVAEESSVADSVMEEVVESEKIVEYVESPEEVFEASQDLAETPESVEDTDVETTASELEASPGDESENQA